VDRRLFDFEAAHWEVFAIGGEKEPDLRYEKKADVTAGCCHFVRLLTLVVNCSCRLKAGFIGTS
jgi:hypothetical protein